jgi:DNA excision repair protein ERCC-2
LTPKPISLSAGHLARAHRLGDLYPGLDGKTQPEEGIATQKKLQQAKGEHYQVEVPVSALVYYAGLTFEVQGRIDGMETLGAGTDKTILVEEYKTTRADPVAAHAQLNSEHWAQARVYAALLAMDSPSQQDFRLRLLYCHPDSLAVWIVEETPTRSELLAWFDAAIAQQGERVLAKRCYDARRDAWLSSRSFPYPSYRPHQRALAACVYQSIRDAQPLLLEAPTGSGKSLGVLYPALKALTTRVVERFLFLTARTTGALAAANALQLLEPPADKLRWVHLRAKQAVCPVPGMPCRADQCEYAKGYFNRIGDAVTSLVARGAMPVEVVAEVAQAHKVCPFELSLDAALEADVVIADYNYVFDPVARLLRFADGQGLGLLIDEAHQLFPRSCEALSSSVPRSLVAAAKAEGFRPELTKRINGIARALTKAAKQTTAISHEEAVGSNSRRFSQTSHASQTSGEPEQLIGFPKTLERALQRFVDTLAQTDGDLVVAPQTRELLFLAIRWLKLAGEFDPERYRAIAFHGQSGSLSAPSTSGGHAQVPTRSSITAELSVGFVCLDASKHIAQTLSRFGADVRFSGTLSPLTMHSALHGRPDTRLERAGSPFAPQQLGCFIVPDVPTYFRQRQQSLPRLSHLVAQIAAAQPGRYLVALPSFAYLRTLHQALLELPVAPRVICQHSGMDATEQANFLDAFGQAKQAIGLVVLGGLFAESVDFADTKISGVICVGVGIAPPSLRQQQSRQHFDGLGLAGEQVTATQPAMVKIVQMAGRLLRSPSDSGVLCLVDDRYLHPEYGQYFPQLWQPQRVRANEMSAVLAEFWAAD